MAHNPAWVAPSEGHDWQDEDVLRASRWLRAFVPERDMERRIEDAREHLLTARHGWDYGEWPPLFDPADAAAWYIFQAETFAVDRQFWVPDAMARIVPVLKRLGQSLDLLRTVIGAEERAARLMNSERRQPDSGLYELLVAAAYRRHGWTRVEFVPEMRGGPRTPDLHVARPRTRWAAECKRLVPNTYATRERACGAALAKPVHALCLARGVSAVVEVKWRVELHTVPAEYLVDRVAEALGDTLHPRWADEVSEGRVRPVNWRLARGVLAHDDVYFGSSRMIELLSGVYVHEADHSMAARWRPAPERPFFAEAVYQASVVSWTSLSLEAMSAKTRHFRSIVADAERQLPDDRPGVVHIGIESSPLMVVAAARHLFNFAEARTFRTTRSRLRWVYANYFMPELTTHRNESWAFTETIAPYKVGRHNTAWPLPNHLVVSPDEEIVDGVFWDPRTPGGRLGPEEPLPLAN